MDELINTLKGQIIDALQLPDVAVEDIETDAPLVGGNMGVDSIDVLELVMMVEEKYGIRIDNKDLGEKVFSSVNALAGYIKENQTAEKVLNSAS